MAITTVVSTSTPSECGPPSHHSVPPLPTVTTGVCLGQQVVTYARMEALMQHFKAAGSSEDVSRLAAAPKRPSTDCMTTSRCASLTGPQDKEFLPGPTTAQIAAFLYYLFETHGLSPQLSKATGL